VNDARSDSKNTGLKFPWIWAYNPYIEAALAELRQQGYLVKDEDVARLSPLQHEHINMLGRYSFSVPDAVAKGALRSLRNPGDDE
jgi:monomeric isocitrate dehydrogenase